MGGVGWMWASPGGSPGLCEAAMLGLCVPVVVRGWRGLPTTSPMPAGGAVGRDVGYRKPFGVAFGTSPRFKRNYSTF